MPLNEALLIHQLVGRFAGDAPKVIGVAVSGGGDSMALLHLMHRASAVAGWRVEAVTVDHCLRAEAADEARMVAGFCAGIGVPHATLVWDHDEIAGNLMDRARRARRALMAGWARQRGIGTVVLGHTADDQAETLLMEMARAAGLDGMSGMSSSWKEQGVLWSRPLLDQSRAHLREYLSGQGIAWADDPTNDDPAYSRVKARRAMRALAPLGITAERLAAVADHLTDAHRALMWAIRQEAARIVREEAGALIIDKKAFVTLPGEFQRRLLIGALRWLSGAEQSPRGAKVGQMHRALLQGKDATLAGCRLRQLPDHLLLVREPRAVGGAVGAAVPEDALWDNRWRVEGPGGTGLHIATLGPEGLRQCPGWRAAGVSRDVLLVTPGVWRGDTLIAAPLAGKPDGWKARIVAGFQSFLVSH